MIYIYLKQGLTSEYVFIKHKNFCTKLGVYSARRTHTSIIHVFLRI